MQNILYNIRIGISNFFLQQYSLPKFQKKSQVSFEVLNQVQSWVKSGKNKQMSDIKHYKTIKKKKNIKKLLSYQTHLPLKKCSKNYTTYSILSCNPIKHPSNTFPKVIKNWANLHRFEIKILKFDTKFYKLRQSSSIWCKFSKTQKIWWKIWTFFVLSR